MEKIWLPDCVSEIGSGCFKGCVSLLKINIPASIESLKYETFKECIKLSDIEISPSVLSIEESCFTGCTSLRNVILPAGITSISNNTFKDCIALTSVVLPQELKDIEYCAFEGCKSLTDIKFPKFLRNIGKRAFYGCSGLESIEFADNNIELDNDIEIGECAFAKCISLSSFSTPNYGLKTISEGMLMGCVNLKEVRITPNINKISAAAFASCPKIKNFIIEDSPNPIEIIKYATCASKFSSMYIGRDIREGTILSQGEINTLELGGYTSKVLPGCFKNFALAKLSLGAGVKEIGEYAFQNNTQLTEVTIPPAVSKIRKGAFNSCPTKIVNLGCGIKEIEDDAFNNIGHLSSINITALTPPSIGSEVFGESYSNMLLSVESIGNTQYLYQNAIGWQNCNMGLLVRPESLSLSVYEINIMPGESYQLYAAIKPSDCSIKNIVWESSNPQIAMINQSGLVYIPINVSLGDGIPSCEIKAYTLYSNSPAAICKINISSSEIGDIKEEWDIKETSDINFKMPYDIYNMSGVCIAKTIDKLDSGVYIVRQRGISLKIVKRN